VRPLQARIPRLPPEDGRGKVGVRGPPHTHPLLSLTLKGANPTLPQRGARGGKRGGPKPTGCWLDAHGVLVLRVMYRNLQHCTAPYSNSQHRTALYSTAQHCTAPYSTVQHCTAPYSTIMYNTVQHCTTLSGRSAVACQLTAVSGFESGVS
jgi:hypothetical protein